MCILICYLQYTSIIFLYNNIPVILKIYNERMQYSLQMHQSFPNNSSLGLHSSAFQNRKPKKKKKRDKKNQCPKAGIYFFFLDTSFT